MKIVEDRDFSANQQPGKSEGDFEIRGDAFAEQHHAESLSTRSVQSAALLITERSFYGSVLTHLSSLVHPDFEPRVYALEHYLYDKGGEALSQPTEQALWSGFLDFVGLNGSPMKGYMFFDQQDYAGCAMGHQHRFFDVGIEFSQEAIALFLKSAEAVVEEHTRSGTIPAPNFRVRPLERVANSIVAWAVSHLNSLADMDQMISKYCEAHGCCQGRALCPEVEETLWWYVGRKVSDSVIQQVGRDLGIKPAAFLSLYGVPMNMRDQPCATATECAALVSLQGRPRSRSGRTD